jgi:hypothetical protein
MRNYVATGLYFVPSVFRRPRMYIDERTMAGVLKLPVTPPLSVRPILILCAI